MKTDFACVHIYTYQNLERILYNKALCGQLSECDYVVFDEAHYFMSDAAFNGKTGQLLRQIPRIFSNSVRIYLSATPDEVLPHITEAEYHARNQWEEEKTILVNGRFGFQTELYIISLTLYQFGRDYRYLNCRYFTESSKIIDKIQFSPTAEKWLVFVSSLTEGQSLVEALGDDAVFLDANSRNIKALAPIWETLVEKNRFDRRVLICTSVLDNVVNIVDDAVKTSLPLPTTKQSCCR
ncbi:MAG: DEAD/DEAH box helicase family protein [Angelakisella sp.]|nr:DEAD/DEAH box helicase family protein [Angelakisella sp.]